MNAYDEIEKLQKRVDALEDTVKRNDGWLRCPNCRIWHEPDGLTVLVCRCGYDFRTRKVREKSDYVIKCPKCKSENVQYANTTCDDVFTCKDCGRVFSKEDSGLSV